MSTLAITAAHLIAIPARYAVGRWYNIPTNTLLIFNAADLGLYILVRGMNYVAREHDWGIANRQAAVLVSRAVSCLAAVYVTSKLTEPMPLKAAAFTELAVTITIAITIATWGEEEK